MRDNEDEPSLLVSYAEAENIIGADILNQAIAAGRIRAIPLNDRPGAPSMFPRSVVERIRRRRS
jgi:hypothetical protein